MRKTALCSLLLSLALILLPALLTAQQANPGLITDHAQTQAEQDAHRELTGEARATRTAALLTEHGLQATVLLCELRKDFSTRTAKPGDDITLSLRKPATLPGGHALPKGTLVLGHIVQTAPHTKTYPNGAMLVTFDKVQPRGGDPTPIFSIIATIAPSDAEQHDTDGAIHHGTIGATSNSPNASILTHGGLGDAIIGQSGAVSGIPGITLTSSPGGSGILIAPNDNAAMFGSQQMILVAGPSSEQSTTQRAYAVLHPAKVAPAPAKPTVSTSIPR